LNVAPASRRLSCGHPAHTLFRIEQSLPGSKNERSCITSKLAHHRSHVWLAFPVEQAQNRHGLAASNCGLLKRRFKRDAGWLEVRAIMKFPPISFSL